MAKYDPEQAFKNMNKQEYTRLTKDRPTVKLGDGYTYYKDTMKKVKPDIKLKIPGGQSVKTLTDLFNAEKSNLMFNQKRMTATELNESKLRMEKYRKQIESILNVEGNTLYDPFNNPADPAPAESTKTIPGL